MTKTVENCGFGHTSWRMFLQKENVFTEGINKMALSSNYDEKIQSINSVERYAHVISEDLACKVKKKLNVKIK